MPEARIQLDYRSDLELMLAVILSAQCTDKRVNLVTPALFARYPSAEALAKADLRSLGALIRTCGLYRSKARNIRAACRMLVEQHGGRVPKTREDLTALPGVGNKSAGVISIHLQGEPAFPVDTHVGRLAYRMGFTKETNPDRVERDLRALFPRHRWGRGHQLLVWHGRRVCHARLPACDQCVVAVWCPRRGVRDNRASS
jgi:endonuclease III